ncbi:MAG: hypothetical protein E7649_03295 [Ruminococcaceae bacterium]|nr:hypothetical protein [Oscillospiraceae bacterium]
MNAYYENTRFNAGTIGTRHNRETTIGDKLISFICAIVAAITCPVAVKLEKATAIVALIFAFFGIIGAMEAQTLSMGIGLILCLAISLFEFLLFKSMAKKSAK